MKDIKQGWQCPVCGNVYAPTVEKCANYHAPQNWQPYPYGVIPWWLQWPYYQPPYYQPFRWQVISVGDTSGTVISSDYTGTLTDSATLSISGDTSVGNTVVLRGTELVSFTNNEGNRNA